MRYSREYLERLAGATGFPPETLEKVLRLERVLDQVARHPFLQTRLLLKGGTALNLFYGRAARLSVDLDFNYVGALARETMLRERPDVERALDQVAAGEEYRVQRAPDEHAGRKFYWSYRNAFGSPDRIEIDLNYMFRVPLVPPTWRDGWTPDADAPCSARVVGFEEAIAGKLVALLDRAAARDLYDVASLVPPPHDPTLLRRLFVALSGILPRPLTPYDTRRLEAFTQAGLDRELAPLLRSTERVEVAVLLTQAHRILSPLLDLSPEERQYVEGLQWGELRPELFVTDQPELASLLLAHPALLWKVENARKRPQQ